MFAETKGLLESLLGGRFEYFLFFPAVGRGRGSRGAARGMGSVFTLKIPGEEGPAGCLRGIRAGGRGARYFLFKPKFPPSVCCSLSP